jgi:hypothetical protein
VFCDLDARHSRGDRAGRSADRTVRVRVPRFQLACSAFEPHHDERVLPLHTALRGGTELHGGQRERQPEPGSELQEIATTRRLIEIECVGFVQHEAIL